MPKILVADKLSEKGVELMKESGLDVDVKTGLSEDELVKIAGGYEGIVVRSASRITAPIIEAADRLKVVGRAGVGVDNIDVPAATRRGIVVMNTPLGNIESAAEHAIALLFTAARNVAQADQSMKSGGWDKKKYTGVELAGKTLGVVGLGKVGQIVCRVMRSLDMVVLACDPFLPAERAEELGVGLVALEELLEKSDFVSLHTPLTDSTRNLINGKSLSLMKPTAILVNCARGGVVDEEALAEALKGGRIKAAGFDVFATEPLPADSPLRSLANLVLTPHLGASTEEAQVRVAEDIARQFVDFFVNGRTRNAVNLAATLTSAKMERYADVADIVGQMVSQMVGGAVRQVQVSVYGSIAKEAGQAQVLALYALRGLLSSGTDEPVNLVNVSLLADTRGIEFNVRTSAQARNFSNYLEVRAVWKGGERAIAGTLFEDQFARIVEVDGLDIELTPSRYMLAMFYEDRPGMVGRFGTILGENNVNIASMAVGREEKRGRAVVVLSLDESVPESAAGSIREAVGTGEVYPMHLDSHVLEG